MPASIRYQNKQLPATPRLDTLEAAAGYDASLSSSSLVNSAVPPGLPPTPASPVSSNSLKTAAVAAAAAAAPDRKLVHHATFSEASVLNKISEDPASRNDSVSSTTALSTRTMLSSEPPASADGVIAFPSPLDPQLQQQLQQQSPPPLQQQKPFVVRNGRSYLADPSLPYPLPVDLVELHRQSLRTLLLFQLFAGPVCSPAFANKPPTRVLEVGCGSGFWSMMCHRFYSRHGHSISFTGVDIAPMGSGSGSNGSLTPPFTRTDHTPDKDMKWRFVQHDMRQMPWPFADEEFDLVMVKDLSLATTTAMQQELMDEYIRILQPGGTLEIWESDHTIRMLRPHVPDAASQVEDDDAHEAAASIGAYVMTANTPLSAPLNPFIVEYNVWVAKALESRSLSAVPCTLIGPILLQESDALTSVGSRRLAVPFSEVRWEREGVGGVVTKDGKSYIETKGKAAPGGEAERAGRTLTAGQAALRQTALLTVVQLIQNLEPLLRDVSGKSQDEWDGWAGKMMNDLMRENGTSWGECLEVGAWWAKKRK